MIIYKNEITITLHPTGARATCRVVGCTNITTAYNSITGTNRTPFIFDKIKYSGSLNNPAASAIYTFGCTNFTHQSNCVNNAWTGFYFNGPNAGTMTVQTNNINNHQYGFHITSSSTMGEQDYTGNLWYRNTYPGWAAWNENLLDASQFRIKVQTGRTWIDNNNMFTNIPLQSNTNPSPLPANGGIQWIFSASGTTDALDSPPNCK